MSPVLSSGYGKGNRKNNYSVRHLVYLNILNHVTSIQKAFIVMVPLLVSEERLKGNIQCRFCLCGFVLVLYQRSFYAR